MQTETRAAFAVDAQQPASNTEANGNPVVADLPEQNGLKIYVRKGFPSSSKL